MPARWQDFHVNGEDFSLKTKDTPEQVESAGYFKPVWDRLQRLDYIRVTADINGPRPPMCWFRVDHIDPVNKDIGITKIGDWDRPNQPLADKRPVDPNKRIDAIVVGIRLMMDKYPDRDNRNFWLKSGLPDARVLLPFTGFPVFAEERDQAWTVIAAQDDRRIKEAAKTAAE